MHRHGRMVHGCRERQVAVGEAAAARQQHRVLRKVEAGDTDVAAFAGACVDHDRAALACRVLLDHDGVGARGHDPTGEDARRLAGAHRAVEGMPGRDLADELEPRRHAGDIGCAHRIAVHRRDVGRRLRAQRVDVGGQHAAVRFGERRGLHGERLGPGEHAGERFGNRHQRHGLLSFTSPIGRGRRAQCDG